MSISLSFTADSLEAIHQQLVGYVKEHVPLTMAAPATQPQPHATNARAALLEARNEINAEGAALIDFVLDQPVERELTWPDLREHIDREDDREALNVLSHLQSFTSRRLGEFVLVKQGGRGRTRYHLNPVYAA